jgi:hypothetical protein
MDALEQGKREATVCGSPNRKRPRGVTVRLPAPAEQGFEERMALMACAFAKGREESLLRGLTAAKRREALEIAQEVAQLSPAARRARIGKAFADREEALERSRRVYREAAPQLRVAMRSALPPYLRPGEEEGDAFGTPTAPMIAFAARLVKEASR